LTAAAAAASATVALSQGTQRPGAPAPPGTVRGVQQWRRRGTGGASNDVSFGFSKIRTAM